jgi:hypothetical protein
VAIEKREQVFVSSTYVDLVEERQEVIQTLLEADCIPSGMELFPASDDDRWTLIKRVIDDSDYYIVVIGGRYGSVDPSAGLSYTEMEYDYAVEQRKPIRGFLHGSPGSISLDKSELAEHSREQLGAFRDKVQHRMIKYWNSPQELGAQVAKSLIQIRKTHPAEGWVRARHALTPEVERELIELRARVTELSAHLETEKVGHSFPVESLAQGDDVYEMNGWIEYDTIPDEGRPHITQTRHTQFSFLISWNELLYGLGPLMIDEASERALSSQLDNICTERYIEGEDEGLRPPDASRVKGVTADADAIHDIKVQLYSLGLIDKSGRRHPIHDRDTYWSLTSRGQDQLTRLRATKRSEESD